MRSKIAIGKLDEVTEPRTGKKTIVVRVPEGTPGNWISFFVGNTNMVRDEQIHPSRGGGHVTDPFVLCQYDPQDQFAYIVPLPSVFVASEFRCTRNKPYVGNCPGAKDHSARQGYYIVAFSADEAIKQMEAKFPDEPEGFTAKFWKYADRRPETVRYEPLC
jgi:hypothetical protein